MNGFELVGAALRVVRLLGLQTTLVAESTLHSYRPDGRPSAIPMARLLMVLADPIIPTRLMSGVETVVLAPTWPKSAVMVRVAIGPLSVNPVVGPRPNAQMAWLESMLYARVSSGPSPFLVLTSISALHMPQSSIRGTDVVGDVSGPTAGGLSAVFIIRV